METEYIISIKTCRICLKREGEKSVFGKIKGRLITDMMLNLTNLEFHMNAFCPTTICINCLNNVVLANEIKSQIQIGDKVIKLLFPIKTKKRSLSVPGETTAKKNVTKIKKKEKYAPIQYPKWKIDLDSATVDKIVQNIMFNVKSKNFPKVLLTNTNIGNTNLDNLTKFSDIPLDGETNDISNTNLDNLTKLSDLPLDGVTNDISNSNLDNLTKFSDLPLDGETNDRMQTDLSVEKNLFSEGDKPNPVVMNNQTNSTTVDALIESTFFNPLDFLETTFDSSFNLPTLLTCSICNVTEADITAFNIHMKIHDDQILLCEFCNKECTEQLLFAHVAMEHSGTNKFYCRLCNIDCVDKNGMTNHRIIEHYNKPDPCEICKKKCSDNFHQKLHNKRHNAELACQFCNKKYLNNYSRVQHIAKKHAVIS